MGTANLCLVLGAVALLIVYGVVNVVRLEKILSKPIEPEGEPVKEPRTYGQIGFEAYGDAAEWKAFDGRPMPRWDANLRPDIKNKWEIAAQAIRDAG